LKKSDGKKLRKVCICLFYLYIIVLSYFLFFSEHYGRGCFTKDYRYNLEFLKEIKRFIRYRQQLGMESFIVNIIGNVFVFMPMGFLLPIIRKKYNNFICILLISIIISLSVELLQLVTKVGIFDVDDILMNSVGSVLGYLMFVIYNKVFVISALKKIKAKEE
jgi:glycopeptide antibiotics resistance protein